MVMSSAEYTETSSISETVSHQWWYIIIIHVIVDLNV